MARTPAHRRRRDPLGRAILAPRIPPPPREQVVTRRVPARPVHPFVAEPGMTDWRNTPLCTCGQPATSAVHRLPGTDPDVTTAEARKLGEKETE